MPQPRKPRGACKGCGQPIPPHKPVAQQFCDSACKGRWWHERRVHDWLVAHPENYQREWVGRAVPPFIRAWLIARQRERTGQELTGCERCLAPFPVAAGGSPRGAIVNHKNGHASDNRPANLELLCGRCEQDDPHNGARNRGRGRQHDRDAYRPAEERAEIARLLRRYQGARAGLNPTARNRALLTIVYGVVREGNPGVTFEQVGRALEALCRTDRCAGS